LATTASERRLAKPGVILFDTVARATVARATVARATVGITGSRPAASPRLNDFEETDSSDLAALDAPAIAIMEGDGGTGRRQVTRSDAMATATDTLLADPFLTISGRGRLTRGR
jgi:hypothetical protein